MTGGEERGAGEKAAKARRAARQARLAAALRDNLRRRKDQVRARAEGETKPGAPSEGPPEGEESGG